MTGSGQPQGKSRAWFGKLTSVLLFAQELAVKDNAGPGSAHHRCPAYAGAAFAGNPFYMNCEHEIIAAAINASYTCDPHAAAGAGKTTRSLTPALY
jgi:hypothetical protein